MRRATDLRHSGPVRRALVMGCVLTLALTAAAGASQTGARAAAATDIRLVVNRVIARRDARAMLDQLKLPAGWVRSASEPRGAGALLRPQRLWIEHTAVVNEWWTTRMSPSSVLAYAKAHPPVARGFRQVITQAGEVRFIWTIDGAHLYSQQLQVSSERLPDGRTGVFVQTQSAPMIPRPYSEQIPKGVHAVAISVRIGRGGDDAAHMRTSTYVVTRPERVAAILRRFGGLPIAQPGFTFSCPVIMVGPHWPMLTLRFETGPHGRTLARAEVSVHRGVNFSDGGSPCGPIEFWIGRKAQTSLTSATFVGWIGGLIDRRIS